MINMMIGEMRNVSEGYRDLFGEEVKRIVALPISGSDRKYFRIYNKEKSLIGVFNPNLEENKAFIGFTKHFLKKELPVPSLLGHNADMNVYFLQDLGDINLFTWLQEKHATTGFDQEAEDLYRKVLDKLILFQINGLEGLDLDLCYPYKSFDRQSMMWDMNYFKYMFLKLIAVPFNEHRLENDFIRLTDFLLESGQEYFLYRDFQSANIMMVGGEPWFIDYQGGRKGAPHYDVASLLFDAKAHIPEQIRQSLLDYQVNNFCSVTGKDKTEFREYFTGFSLIRLMQALGAFGFRGLYEKKPTFAGSIVPAVKLITDLITSSEFLMSHTELYQTIRLIPDTKKFNELAKENSLI